MNQREIITVAVIGALGIYILSRVAGKAVGEGLEAIRPTNNNNIFARGVDAIGDVLNDGQDDGDFSLGGWIYDVTHPSTYPNPPAPPIN